MRQQHIVTTPHTYRHTTGRCVDILELRGLWVVALDHATGKKELIHRTELRRDWTKQ